MSTVGEEIVQLIPQLRRFATSLTGDRTAADDLVQDVILRALSKIEEFQEGTNPRVWLFTIMRDLYVNQMRRYGNKPALVAAGRDPGASPASLENCPQFGDVEAALQALPEEQRSTLLLVILEGFTYEEIAIITGLPVDSVRSCLSRARESLRQLLSNTAAV